jgi:hypothetical protein
MFWKELIISFSSERCREFYNIFPKICIPSLNLWRVRSVLINMLFV